MTDRNREHILWEYELFVRNMADAKKKMNGITESIMRSCSELIKEDDDNSCQCRKNDYEYYTNVSSVLFNLRGYERDFNYELAEYNKYSHSRHSIRFIVKDFARESGGDWGDLLDEFNRIDFNYGVE